jgi:hypothetical protein
MNLGVHCFERVTADPSRIDIINDHPEDLERFTKQWQARGYLAQEQLLPEDQAQALVDILTSRAQIDVIWVRPKTLLQLWE